MQPMRALLQHTSCSIFKRECSEQSGTGRAQALFTASTTSKVKLCSLGKESIPTVYRNILFIRSRDANGSDTDGYHCYYIYFHISIRIWIQIRIVSAMSDRIRLDIDIMNMRFEYSDTDTVSDVEYPDSDTDRSQPL